MTQAGRNQNVLQFQPSSSNLIRLVHETARDSSKVNFSDHAYDRMEERGITALDTLRVLRAGDIKGPIEAGKNKGEWKCKIVMQMKGTREVGVVVVVMVVGRLFVKTVEWEDMK